MRHIHVNLCFWNCEATEVADVVVWARVLQRHGIILLAHYTLEPLLEKQWEEVFRTQREEEEYFKSSIGHVIAFEDWGKLNARFDFQEYAERQDGGNKLELGSLLDFQFKDERPLVEPFAQRMLAIARDLYALARPTYGGIDGDWGEWNTKAVSRLRLQHLGWVNFFGPPYVEKYGRDFLLGLPGYKTELLPDGGVFHQLSPTFVAADEEEAQRLRRQVIAYCRRRGYKVTCRAPYVIPGLTRLVPPEEPLDDADLILYLDHILPTTLVLDDGTRLKHLYIPWRGLNPWQREMVVARLKQALIAEVKGGGWKRLRLEFNEIPAELEQMLVELFGRGNPDVEWAEVAME